VESEKRDLGGAARWGRQEATFIAPHHLTGDRGERQLNRLDFGMEAAWENESAFRGGRDRPGDSNLGSQCGGEGGFVNKSHLRRQGRTAPFSKRSVIPLTRTF